ncbi:MAG: hypothetical protein KGL10_00870 [Alphaproteobacteria bacterium]|nr:hypothetical protein [Alphaproteobacteria bacterium]
MKHIESSRLIKVPDAVETAAVKYSLVERLRGIFHIETVGEGDESFTLAATGKDVPCHCLLNVLLKTDEKHARVIVDGQAKITAPTKILYTLGVLALLILGQFHGIINTSGTGNAEDLMVFLFLGIFILFDVGKKLSEPERMIDRVLAALETEFGS